MEVNMHFFAQMSMIVCIFHTNSVYSDFNGNTQHVGTDMKKNPKRRKPKMYENYCIGQ